MRTTRDPRKGATGLVQFETLHLFQVEPFLCAAREASVALPGAAGVPPGHLHPLHLQEEEGELPGARALRAPHRERRGDKCC